MDKIQKGDLKVMLVAKTIDITNNMKIAKKLHSQFLHPLPKKSIKPVSNVGMNDGHLKDAISEVSKKFEICKVYRKPGFKPGVSVSLAEEFNEALAMDLKIFKSSIILHLVDHVRRFSAAAVVKLKDRNEIIKHLFRTWISIFGAPSKLFSDNGEEFCNEDYNEMCDFYNITIKKIDAESPFSSGLVERHNAILDEILLKTCEESGPSLEIALQWVINAKNLLSNVHGFFPYQVVFNMNPRLPKGLSNRPPALEGLSESKIVASNLRSMHETRKTFIKSESSEKISHALRHNLRSYKDAVFTE